MENLKFAKKETLLKKYNENVKNRKNVIEKLLELTKQQQSLEKEKQKVEDQLTELNKERVELYNIMVKNEFIIK